MQLKHPLFVLTAVFALGIFFAERINISFGLIYSLIAGSLLVSILSFNKGLSFNIFLLCLCFSLGLAVLKSHNTLPGTHILKYIHYKNDSPYLIKGIIGNQAQFKTNRTIFIFKTQQIQFDDVNHNCSGKILVYLKGRTNLSYGEELILSGKVYKTWNKNWSRQKSYYDYLANQGIYLIINVKSANDIVRLNRNRGLIHQRLAFMLKEKIEGMIFKHVASLPAAILEAMILGEKRNVPWFVNKAMMQTGTLHILVVSGFNVGIVAFMIMLFLKFIRFPKWLRFYTAVSLLILYCLMTGASNPVVRATVMAIVFMSAYRLKREADIYNSLSVAAIFILGINPRQLFDVGFQLSFVSVISIIYFYPKIKLLLRLESLKIKTIKFILDGLLVSLSAWLGTVGLVAYYFKIFAPVAILANIFVVPLAAVITLTGFSMIIMSLICPYIACLFASSCELLVMLLININLLFLKIPGAYFYLS